MFLKTTNAAENICILYFNNFKYIQNSEGMQKDLAAIMAR